jgi:hypothetical protein
MRPVVNAAATLCADHAAVFCPCSPHACLCGRYFFSLPFLAWRAALPTPVRLALLAGIEACWNVYPPTRAASAALWACHALLLAGLAAAQFDTAGDLAARDAAATTPQPRASAPRTRARAKAA